MVSYILFCPYFYFGELSLFAFLIFSVNKHGVAKLVIILKLECIEQNGNGECRKQCTETAIGGLL